MDTALYLCLFFYPKNAKAAQKRQKDEFRPFLLTNTQLFGTINSYLNL
jgi:hypothetical protein